MILAIDLGSTSFKAAVFNEQFEAVSTGKHKVNYVYPEKSHVELEPGEIQNGIIDCVKGALDGYAADIKAIAITSQAQTFAVFDQENKPKHNFISWLDERAGDASKVLKDELTDFTVHAGFGSISPALQCSLLKHLVQNSVVAVDSGDRIVSLASYAAFLLTGSYVIDNNLAAMQGLYSLKENNWWDDALQSCGITEKQLPQLVNVGDVACQTNENAIAGLNAGIPVVMAGNDQTAGAYGVDLHEHDSMLMTLGTAYVVYGLSDELPEASTDWIRGVYPGGKYYKLAADKCGASVIEWAARVLVHDNLDDPDALFHLAEKSEKGAGGVSFDPLLVSHQGGWTGLGMRNSREDMARAVLESLVERVVGMLKRIGGNKSYSSILAAGGHSKAELYIKMLTEDTGWTFAKTKADPLLGAAKMGHKAL
jgi:sugar (pentulose or hexulose) kinase